MSITQERLKELVHYDPLTGFFVLKKYRGGRVKEGEILGSKTQNGYVEIKVDGKTYKAHRLAFIYMEGRLPSEVDHLNRVRNDNSWANLKDSTRGENCRNRGALKHRYLPVGVYAHRNKFKAMVGVDYRPKYLGLFDTPELASEARVSYIKQLAEYLDSKGVE